MQKIMLIPLLLCITLSFSNANPRGKPHSTPQVYLVHQVINDLDGTILDQGWHDDFYRIETEMASTQSRARVHRTLRRYDRKFEDVQQLQPWTSLGDGLDIIHYYVIDALVSVVYSRGYMVFYISFEPPNE